LVASRRRAALSIRTGNTAPFADVRSTTPTAATFSPDGRWVAYGSTSGGRQTVYVQPFPATGAKFAVDANGLDTPCHPLWSRDGKELFYNPRPLGLDVVGVSTSPTFTFGRAAAVPRPFQLSPPELRRAYDVTPTGRFVARVSATGEAYGAGGELQVVVNWFEEVRARVAAAR
jgi:serine/threonine-protein kinase